MKTLRLVQMGIAWVRGAAKVGYPPRLVSIEPTNVCNYRCPFCPQSDPRHHTRPKGLMKLEHLDDLLRKISEAKAAPHGTISFTHDGEPLLHPEFPEFIRRANHWGFAPRFSSNGSKLTPEKADLLERAGGFRASIDWSCEPAIFEANRGRRDDWELVRANLSYLVEMADRNPKVSVEIFEMGTYQRPEDGKAMLKRLKSILPTSASGRVEFGIRVFHNAAGAAPRSAAADGENAGNRPPGKQKPRYRKCPYPWSAMVIAFNGDLHACCRDLQGRTCLGNLLEADSLWEIWNGEEYQKFRHLIATRQPEKLGACCGCDLPWSGNEAKWSVGNILRTLRRR